LTITFSVPGNSAGPFTSPRIKFLLHTTEGTSIEGAVGAYRANNSWPHDTVDFMFGHNYRICHHLSYDLAGRSLRNEPGGVQTNTAGVVQVEVVGFATRPDQIDWRAFAIDYLGPRCRQLSIPIASSVTWVAYPASYGKNARQRLSGAAWLGYRGILGHEHCPENDHGDPGAIPIQLILAAAQGQAPPPPPPPPPPEEDDDMKPYIQRDPQGSEFYIWENVVVFLGNGQTSKDYAVHGYEVVPVADATDAKAIRDGHALSRIVSPPVEDPGPDPVDADPNS
jgi:hypothetical protein